MNNETLKHYLANLAETQQNMQDFAKQHPAAARNLSINKNSTPDAHTERLIEAFSFLKAEIQQTIDDDFDLFSQQMIQCFFGMLLRPIPSYAIAELQPSNELNESQQIPKGTDLAYNTDDGELIQFKTAHHFTLQPVKISHVNIKSTENSDGEMASIYDSKLEIKLNTLNSETPFSSLNLSKLRFYIDADSRAATSILKTISHHQNQIQLAADSGESRLYDMTHLTQAGFGKHETMISGPDSTPDAYQHLVDFFYYQKKFQFFEIDFKKVIDIDQHEIVLNIYLNNKPRQLKSLISDNGLKLNCVPLINLFREHAEPIFNDHTKTEHKITIDSRRPDKYMLFEVEKITGSNSDLEAIEYLPLFYKADEKQEAHEANYQIIKKKSQALEEGMPRFEDYLLLHYPETHLESNQFIDIDGICMNRYITESEKEALLSNELFFSKSTQAVKCARIVSDISDPKPALAEINPHWRLIASLHISNSSLTSVDKKSSPLKNLLALYADQCDETHRHLINSITSIKSKACIERLTQQNINAFAQGQVIEIAVEPSRFVHYSIESFAKLLETLFAHHTACCSFIKLKLINQHSKQLLFAGRARNGNQYLV